MSLMDIVTELLEDTPENRPQSPRSRPAEKPANKGLSPQSPQSPLGRVKIEKKAGFEDIEDIEHRNENKKTTFQVVHPKLQKKLWDIEPSLASSNGPHNLYHDQNTQNTQKPYTETELEVPVRQPHCPAYPNDGPHAGPTKEWCQQAMG